MSFKITAVEPDITLASTTETQDELDHATSENWREPFDPDKAKAGREQREADAAAEQAKKDVAGKAPTTAGGKVEGEGEPEDDNKPLPKGVQRRIDTLTRKLREAEVQLAERAEKPEKPEKPGTPTEDKEPLKKDFADPDEWVKAHGLWAGREALRRNAAATATEAEAAHAQEVFDAHLGRLETFRAEHPDFDEKIDASTTKFSEAVAVALVEADNGPAIVYHLALHPEELEKISKMSRPRQVMEIGRISASLAPSTRSDGAAAPITTRPRTPAPITSEKTTKVATTVTDPAKMSTDEFIRSRNEAERNQRRRR